MDGTTRMNAKEHWRRDKPSRYNFLALERSALDGPEVFGGLHGAVMSRDEKSHSETLLVELPIGWKAAQDAKFASVELFVLRGDLALDGTTVGAGGFVHLPQGAGGGELRSERGAVAIAWSNPNIPAFPPPVTRNVVTRAWDLPWTPSLGEGNHGLMHKSLRQPDPTGNGFDGGPGGFLRLATMSPGIEGPYEHVHDDCWEEIIFLQGDSMLVNQGINGFGTVLSHPQGWWHGPFASRSGALFLNHTDAPMGFPWPPREYPHADEICKAYLDQTPWDQQVESTAWAEMDTRITALQEPAEFQAWRSSDQGAEYAPVADDISTFRSGWRRTI